ncbi:MAG: 2-oxo acid dehydrogenase subunit E2, partial [Terracoccus sp.]
MSDQSTTGDPMASFGPNEWLVDELYQRFLKDKSSVDKAWWTFFEDYQPQDGGESNGGESNGGQSNGGQSNGGPSNGGTSRTVKPANPPAEKSADHGATGPSNGRATASSASSADSNGQSAEKASPAADMPEPKPQPKGEPRTESATETRSAPEHTAATAKKPAAPTPRTEQSSPTPRDIPQPKESGPVSDAVVKPLRGATARDVSNMETSLGVPTASSVRAVPAKLLIDNRVVINNHLARSRGGKVSFTHIIGYAMVKALELMPEMNNGFVEQDGKPALMQPAHVNFGLAIDLQKPDGSRTLVVPSIKSAESMDFVHFWTAYEDMVRKARTNKLTVEDFKGTTISLTNPGGIGTVHSVPRLMAGQGAIIGVGALEYPAQWQGASSETLNRNAVSKILTLTSTYDHRIIQGAQSG